MQFNEGIKKKTSNTQLKERILHAAQKLFVEKGYYNTSIPDVVKEAGVSTGAVYHYFLSKEDLAKEIHNNAVEQYLTKYDEEVRPKESTYDKIRAYTSLMFRWTEDNPVMVQYLLYARPKEILNKSLTVCSEEGHQGTKEIIESGIKQKEIKHMDPNLSAAVISGTLIRMIEFKLDGFIEHSLVEYIEATANTIWLSVKA